MAILAALSPDSETSKKLITLPKGPSRTVFSTESGSVVFVYSVENLPRVVMDYSKYGKSLLKM